MQQHIITTTVTTRTEWDALILYLTYLRVEKFLINNISTQTLQCCLVDSLFQGYSIIQFELNHIPLNLNEWNLKSYSTLFKQIMPHQNVRWVFPYLNLVFYEKISFGYPFIFCNVDFSNSFINSIAPFVWFYYCFKKLIPTTIFDSFDLFYDHLIEYTIKSVSETPETSLKINQDFFNFLEPIKLLSLKINSIFQYPEKRKKVYSPVINFAPKTFYRFFLKNNEISFILISPNEEFVDSVYIATKYTDFQEISNICFTGYLWFILINHTEDNHFLNPCFLKNKEKKYIEIQTTIYRDSLISIKPCEKGKSVLTSSASYSNNNQINEEEDEEEEENENISINFKEENYSKMDEMLILKYNLKLFPIIPKLYISLYNESTQLSLLVVMSQLFDSALGFDSNHIGWCMHNATSMGMIKFATRINNILNLKFNSKIQPIYQEKCKKMKIKLASSQETYLHDSEKFFESLNLPVNIYSQDKIGSLNFCLSPQYITSHGGITSAPEVSTFSYLTKSSSLKPFEVIPTDYLDEHLMNKQKPKKTYATDELDIFFINFFNKTNQTMFYHNQHSVTDIFEYLFVSFQCMVNVYLNFQPGSLPDDFMVMGTEYLNFFPHSKIITSETKLFLGNLEEYNQVFKSLLETHPDKLKVNQINLSNNTQPEIPFEEYEDNHSFEWGIYLIPDKNTTLIYNFKSNVWFVDDGFSLNFQKRIKIDNQNTSLILEKGESFITNSTIPISNILLDKNDKTLMSLKEILDFDIVKNLFSNLEFHDCDLSFMKTTLTFNIILTNYKIIEKPQKKYKISSLKISTTDLLVWKAKILSLYKSNRILWNNKSTLANIILSFSMITPFASNLKVFTQPNIPFTKSTVIKHFKDTHPNLERSMLCFCFLFLSLEDILPDILKNKKIPLKTHFIILDIISTEEIELNFGKIEKKMIFLDGSEVHQIIIPNSIFYLILSSSHFVIVKNNHNN